MLALERFKLNCLPVVSIATVYDYRSPQTLSDVSDMPFRVPPSTCLLGELFKCACLVIRFAWQSRPRTTPLASHASRLKEDRGLQRSQEPENFHAEDSPRWHPCNAADSAACCRCCTIPAADTLKARLKEAPSVMLLRTSLPASFSRSFVKSR
jgi:hypothetical protein